MHFGKMRFIEVLSGVSEKKTRSSRGRKVFEGYALLKKRPRLNKKYDVVYIGMDPANLAWDSAKHAPESPQHSILCEFEISASGVVTRSD